MVRTAWLVGTFKIGSRGAAPASTPGMDGRDPNRAAGIRVFGTTQVLLCQHCCHKFHMASSPTHPGPSNNDKTTEYDKRNLKTFSCTQNCMSAGEAASQWNYTAAITSHACCLVAVPYVNC